MVYNATGSPVEVDGLMASARLTARITGADETQSVHVLRDRGGE